MPRKAKTAKAKIEKPAASPSPGVTGTMGGAGAPIAGLTTRAATPVGHTSPGSSVDEEKERQLAGKGPALATGGRKGAPRRSAKAKKANKQADSTEDFDPHAGNPRTGFSPAEQRRHQRMQPIGLQPQPIHPGPGHGTHLGLMFEGVDMLRRMGGYVESPEWLDWKNRVAAAGGKTAAESEIPARAKSTTAKRVRNKPAGKSGQKAKRGPGGRFVKRR